MHVTLKEIIVLLLLQQFNTVMLLYAKTLSFQFCFIIVSLMAFCRFLQKYNSHDRLASTNSVKTSQLFLKTSQFPNSFSTSSLQMLAGLWLHAWDARLLCSPGMNPSEWSLEYSLLNLGEGHRIQPFSAPLPSEQPYGHGAP